MANITTLIPCNVWTFSLIIVAWFLIVAIADRWDTNDRYRKLENKLNQQNQDKSHR